MAVTSASAPISGSTVLATAHASASPGREAEVEVDGHLGDGDALAQRRVPERHERGLQRRE
ncbi:MAG: hypothetical protein ACRD03_18020 [Acidimicrobiales bacterium]